MILQEKEIATESEKLITIKEAADLIHLAVPTIYNLVSKKKIPHYKRGKRLYFFKEELIDWIKENKVKTDKEIELEADDYLNSARR